MSVVEEEIVHLCAACLPEVTGFEPSPADAWYEGVCDQCEAVGPRWRRGIEVYRADSPQ